MKKKRNEIVFVLICAILLSVCGKADIAKAATLKVFITEGTLNHAINRTMVVGETRDGWEIELNNDRTVKKATWTSSNTGVVTVSGNTSGATVTAHKEGTAVLSLTVVTNEDETVSTECLVSVVTLFEPRANGYVKSSAALYRGASTSSEVRNTAPANQEMEIIGACENFYRVKLPENYEFNDELNQVVAFARKADIEIPVTTLTITNANQASNLKIGDSVTLTMTSMPVIATRKNFTWSSSDDTIVTVSNEGKVTAKKAGVATVTVTETYSGVKSAVKISVSDILVTSVAIINEKEIKTLNVGETKKLEISLLPENATKKELQFFSSNEKVATVDGEGNVTAKRKGTTTITVVEIHSQQSATLKLRVLYQTLSAKKSKPKIKLKTSTDFSGNHLAWDTIKNVSYYTLHIGQWNKSKSKIVYKSIKLGKKKKSHYDQNVLRGKKYYYYIKAYNKSKKNIAKSKKVMIIATAPQVFTYLKDKKEILLDWTSENKSVLKGVKGYRVYRSEKKKGKYKCVKQIKKKNVFSFTDKKVKEGKDYYYKVCAYRRAKKKIMNGAFSPVAKETTYKISKQTNIEYFNKVKESWKGISVDTEVMTKEQSSAKMKNYTVVRNGVSLNPYIKYHMTPETLYIHVYVQYVTYVNSNGKAIESDYVEEKGFYDESDSEVSYKQQFETGIKENYRTLVMGSDGDFQKGVNFRTELVVHEKGKESYASGQSFLKVAIGGECPYSIAGTCDKNHWFHTHTFDENVFHGKNIIYMTDYKNGNETVIGYQNMAGHELGHILGLWDGYYDKENRIDRLLENRETCYYVTQWTNIMESTRKRIQMTPNDFEMMLLAYGRSFDFDVIQGKETIYQYYNQISAEQNVSPVIINRKDEEDENNEK